MILIVFPMGIVGHSIWNFGQFFFFFFCLSNIPQGGLEQFCHCAIYDE